MAISHIQHLLLLLASLFFVPALSSVDFEYCNKNGYVFGEISSVKITPNPVKPEDYLLNITVNGYAKESINKGTIEVYSKSDKETDLVKRSDLVIKKATNFELLISEVIKDELEGEYKYVISFLDNTVADESGKPVEKMCVNFKLPTSSAPTLVSS